MRKGDQQEISHYNSMTLTGTLSCAVVHIVLIHISICPGRSKGGGGVLPEKLGGGGVQPTSQNPNTLTLFMTKLYDFPFPIYDLKK